MKSVLTSFLSNSADRKASQRVHCRCSLRRLVDALVEQVVHDRGAAPKKKEVSSIVSVLRIMTTPNSHEIDPDLVFQA